MNYEQNYQIHANQMQIQQPEDPPNLSQYLNTADNYQQMDPREHVLSRPGMYIGSAHSYDRIDRILDMSNTNKIKFINGNIKWPEGCERIFLEILTNASDNIVESRTQGFDVGEIVINMNNKSISILNGGKPIPVQMKPEKNMWVPEFILGSMLTSSNYSNKKVRTGAGVNGLGAKLTNIYSLSFTVKIGDPYNELEYTQTWKNNMTERSDPIITPYTGKAYTYIEYETDFSRFMSNNDPVILYTEHDNEAYTLYARHAADIAYACKVPIIFNGIRLEVQDIYTYAMWMGNYNENCLIHYEWPLNTKTTSKKIGKRMIQYAVDSRIMPIVELCILDTPDSGSITAYVNCMITRGDGVHVDAAQDATIKKILSIINNTDTKKGKKKGKDTSRKFKLNAGDVKRHLSIIISCHLNNPEYVGGNTKDKLRSPKPKIKIEDEELKLITNWDIVERLYAELEAKQFRALAGKGKLTKKKNIKTLTGFDATCAGDPKKSHLCSLFLVEGESAKTMAVGLISKMSEGSEYYGVFPLKGKLLNVMKSGFEQYYNNKEIEAIKEYLNIKEGIDYRDQNARNTLRYGKVIYLMDSDDDGKHIEGLALTLFYHKFNTLLSIPNFFMTFRTPIIKARKGKEHIKFYTIVDYKSWANTKNNILTGWKFKYYKGLGRFEEHDIESEIRNPLTTQYIYDDQAPYYFNLAFAKKTKDERKMWITRHVDYDGIEKFTELPMSSFINYEVIRHSMVDVLRNIPSMRDGFKPSYRKVVRGCYVKWKTKTGSHTTAQVKTAGLAGIVTEETNYPYGEISLVGCIDHMCLTYPGTHNIQLLYAHGDHGKRINNGKTPAAPRYTYTRPTYIWPYLFKTEDNDLLIYIYDEGKYIEPEFYLPVIPLSMDGVRGIGTGFSSTIQSYNPIDIKNWLCCRIRGMDLPTLIPWYKNFKGTVQIIDKNNVESITPSNIDLSGLGIYSLSEIVMNKEEENEIEKERMKLEMKDMRNMYTDYNINTQEKDENDDDDPLGLEEIGFSKKSKSNIGVLTTGCFHMDGTTVIITELPIGISMEAYNKWLIKLRDEKDKGKLKIRDFKMKLDQTIPYFEIYGFDNPTYKRLRLNKSYSMGNMVLLDINNKPKRYKTIDMLIEDWFQWRYPYYEKRKQNMIKVLDEKIILISWKIKFVLAIIDGTIRGKVPGENIVVMNIPKADIFNQTQLMNFPSDIGTKFVKETKLYTCTYEQVNKLKQSLDIWNTEKEIIVNIPASNYWLKDLDEFEKAYNERDKYDELFKDEDD